MTLIYPTGSNGIDQVPNLCRQRGPVPIRFGNQASFELSNKPVQFNQDFLVPLCIILLALL